MSSEVRCVLDKNHKPYFFHNGKRISRQKAQALKKFTSCKSKTGREYGDVDTIKCTLGKNREQYFFQNGKRISKDEAKRSGKVEKCVGKENEESFSEMEIEPKQKLDHVWLWGEMLIPTRDGDGKYLIVPIKEVGAFPDDVESILSQHSKDNLVVVSEKYSKAYNSFRDQRVGWSFPQWEGFENTILPYWLSTLSKDNFVI